MPCGICLQTLAEFADEAQVLVAARGELYKQTTLRELLPQPFVFRPEE
jgi:cytidine deaminase